MQLFFKLALAVCVAINSYQAMAKTTFSDVMKLWEEECGESKYPDAGPFNLKNFEQNSDTLIVGGETARRNEFPWQISMNRRGTGGEFYHSCGGSIINQEWILTAAHCVDNSATNSYLIVVGAWNITAKDEENTVQQFEVDEIIPHENFDGYTFENDVAVIHLVGTIEYNENVQPICPASPDHDYTNEQCIVSGWGANNSYVGPGDQFYPDVLQWVSIPITPQQACVDKYGILGDIITEDMICAGLVNETERDACQGDSGGPLFCQNSTTSRFHQVGVVSWGRGCANRFPGVYARVSYFLDWIDGTIGSLW